MPSKDQGPAGLDQLQGRLVVAVDEVAELPLLVAEDDGHGVIAGPPPDGLDGGHAGGEAFTRVPAGCRAMDRSHPQRAVERTKLRPFGSHAHEAWSAGALVAATRFGQTASMHLEITTVQWDDRIPVGDGGRDIVVTTGAPEGRGLLLRRAPAIWSIKSGVDGLSPAKLEHEITDDDRRHIVQALRGGRDFVWCALQAAGPKKKKALEDRAAEIGTAQGFQRERITFWYSEHLATALERFRTLVPGHLPELANDLHGRSVEQWTRPTLWLDTSVPWVDFEERAETVRSIRAHFTAPGGRNVLHVGGISGIGKTRAALEAVSTDDLKKKVVYYDRFERFERHLQWITDNPQVRSLLVVDEIRAEQWLDLTRRVADLGESVRIVTIGAMPRDQRPQPGIIVLPEPQTEAAMVQILDAATSGTLNREVSSAIASVSNHDLRLGILLARAMAADPELSREPSKALEVLEQPRLIYNRILALFDEHLAHVPRFREDYPALAFAAEVGIRDDAREELSFLARELDLREDDLSLAVGTAVRCGLGTYPGRFFEASPRALAVIVFESFLWPRVRERAQDILDRLPSDRLLRSFVRRVELCSSTMREEVRRGCDTYFRGRLKDRGVRDLADPNLAKIYRCWSEIYPEDGLEWLRFVIAGSATWELQQLGGSSGMLGPTGGRRDLVLLCEHLACFGEHFAVCEEILFRLAVAENEPIGNNATNVWKEKFHLVLSNPELPFQALSSAISLIRARTCHERSIDCLHEFHLQHSRYCADQVFGV